MMTTNIISLQLTFKQNSRKTTEISEKNHDRMSAMLYCARAQAFNIMRKLPTIQQLHMRMKIVLFLSNARSERSLANEVLARLLQRGE